VSYGEYFAQAGCSNRTEAVAKSRELEYCTLAKIDEVEVSLVEGKIIIQPVIEHQWTLDQLLAGVMNENLHTEIETGQAVGN